MSRVPASGVLRMRPLFGRGCSLGARKLSKKGFITDAIVDFYSYIVFVIVIIVFAILFKLSHDAKTQRLKDIQGVNDANFLVQVLLREPIMLGGEKMTYADLLALYDNNQSKARKIAAQEAAKRSTAEAVVDALVSPYTVPFELAGAILFGEENEYYTNIDSLTSTFLKINVEENPKYSDKCYYFIVRAPSFMYTKVSEKCSGDFGRGELFDALKAATIPFGAEGVGGATQASSSGATGAVTGAAAGATYGLALGPAGLLGGAVLGYFLDRFEVNLCSIPQSSYITYVPNLDPRKDNIVVLFMLDVPRLVEIYQGDEDVSCYEKKAEESAASVAPGPGAVSSSPPPSSSSVPGAPITGDVDAVVESEAKRLGIELAFAKAIMQVESGGKWFSSDNRIIIRMEPHVFNGQSHSDVGSWTNKGAGKDGGENKITGRKIADVSCEGGLNGDYACFEKAKTINEVAAYNSISMGAGQIMGFNSKMVGYNSGQEMFTAFQSSAGNQAKAMFKLIEANARLLSAARSKDFSVFASIYNGDRTGRYAGKLESAYRAQGGASAPPSGGVVV